VQQVLETAAAINENYVDGKTDNHYLVCPTAMTTSRSLLVTSGTGMQSGAYRVGPNPSAGRFTVTLPVELNNATIIVTDASGAVVQRRQSVNTIGGQTLQLDLSGRANGLYMLRIVSGSKIFTQKLMLQK
jgi:hypothetical protein